MSVNHTPSGEVTSSVNTYSCLLDSRTKLPVISFRHMGTLYDLSGHSVPRAPGRNCVPLFALEDSVKKIRSDGAYDYAKLSGEETRRTVGHKSQTVEEGTFYPSDSWENDGFYQPYGYSLVFGAALNDELHRYTVEDWIWKAISGEVCAPTSESPYAITGGIIPDGITEKIEIPIDVQDYMTDNKNNSWGHTVWALGYPYYAGFDTFHTGQKHMPVLDTIVGIPEDANLCLLSSTWLYPECKHYSYSTYIRTEINRANGVRIDNRYAMSESLYSKRGQYLTFNNEFKGWYDPLFEISVGTPRSFILHFVRLYDGRQQRTALFRRALQRLF